MRQASLAEPMMVNDRLNTVKQRKVRRGCTAHLLARNVSNDTQKSKAVEMFTIEFM